MSRTEAPRRQGRKCTNLLMYPMKSATATATRTSSAGFGSKTESCSQYMKNFLRQHKGFSLAQVAQQQTAWLREYSTRNHTYSLDDLLQCEHSDLVINESLVIPWANKSDIQIVPVIQGFNGFWHIHVTWNKLYKIYQFTLCVLVGDAYRFQPEAIKRDITTKYGSMIYETWRSMVLDDLPSLVRLVECIRERITFVAPSISCSQSAARLCRQVGIPVRNDVAFLFPAAYS